MHTLKPLIRSLLAAFALSGGMGCSTVHENGLRDGETREVADSIFCGTGMPNGRSVSSSQWQDFVLHEVTPRYPQSMTDWHAWGQWLTEDGLLEREKTYVLYLVHPRTPQDNQKVQAIMDAYRLRFHQEAVLQVRSTVLVYLDTKKL